MNNGNGFVGGDPVVQKAGNLPRTRSFFDERALGYNFFTTNRFGEIAPFFWMENVDGDKKLHLNSASKVDSYTLKSPLMQDIKMKKDLFYVPRQAILPLNWEKFYTNPNIGEDVPEDCGTGVRSFWYKVAQLCDFSYFESLSDMASDAERWLSVCKWFVFFEMFYSNGNLLSNLGIHGSKFARFTSSDLDFLYIDFDSLFDRILDPSVWQSGSSPDYHIPLKHNNEYYCVCEDNDIPNDWVDVAFYNYHTITFREFLDLLRDDLIGWSAIHMPDGGESEDPYDFGLNLDEDWSLLESISFSSDAVASTDGVDGDDLDIARLWAYQLVCHHFYSNDHVDYIYSAELFRQYIGNFVSNAVGYQRFNWNGVYYQYDYLSAYYFGDMIASFDFDDSDIVSYFQALLSFRHSLRYVDYFTGARTRPLAVGDTDVDVNNNVASVIDITRNIQKQRFLNALNRIGRKISDYSMLMGGDGMRPDFHDPLYIGHTSDVIYGDRSEYTGNVADAEQNNITSLLKNAGAKYGFSWEVDRVGIAIGVCYYDISRIYTESIERQAFHMNRFDMFNPFMQFQGDQKIYKSEILTGGQTPFGYANRNIEYKQRFDQAAGGFVADSALPEWIFVAERGIRRYEDSISPKFIRSSNSEFDRFYVSLTGYSLGTYFHFIVRHINACSASRPMVVAPDILQ